MEHSRHSITVTANNRLARGLLAKANTHAEAEGSTAWERPAILPWGAWIHNLYDELVLAHGETRALLPALAETFLWEDIVAEHTTNDPLLDVSGAADSIQAAWWLLCEYEVPLKAVLAYATAEAELLDRCCSSFFQRCEAMGLLDAARLTRRLCAAFEKGELPLPQEVLFYGFDEEQTPTRQRLISTLERKGVRVTHGAATLHPVPGKRVEFDNGDLEVRSAVRWAAARLMAEPKERVAIVVPQLAHQRGRLLHELEEALEPHSLLPGAHPQRTLFNLSLGEALSTAPLVHDALLWWRLAAGATLQHGELLVLLRSPFCADAEEEAEARALFGRELSRHGRPEMDLEAIVALTERCAERSAAHGKVPPRSWLSGLARFCEESQKLATCVQPAARWRRALRELLATVGWPGERALDSDEYQQMQSLGEVLDGLASLDLGL
ncbi:MAG: hypothetical protein JRH20_32525 [Deltaproteobacteria bacterium]|nr:hypothetical protein [Deltaproteobacteria bacterium]